MVNGAVSSWCLVTVGVPQGKVFSPVLLNIFIEEIESALSKFTKTKLGGRIRRL